MDVPGRAMGQQAGTMHNRHASRRAMVMWGRGSWAPTHSQEQDTGTGLQLKAGEKQLADPRGHQDS